MSQEIQNAVRDVDASNNNAVREIEKIMNSASSNITKQGKNINDHDIRLREHADRILSIEQSGGGSHYAPPQASNNKSISARFAESEEIQNYIAGRTKNAGLTVKSQVILPEIQNNTIITADPTSPPQQLSSVIGGPEKKLGLRQMFINIPATGGSFTYQKELAFTNNAEAQDGDGTLKAESGVTFEEKVQQISTYAHWLKISKQVLADAPQTVDFTGRRLFHGLESKVENAIINGDGTTSKLSGLLHTGNFTAFSPSAGTDGIQNLRSAKTALQNADFDCNLYILNPDDAEAMDLIQDTTGQYVFGDPKSSDAENIWNVPVYVSTYMASGSFIALDRLQAATIHTREDALITLSDSDGTDFTKNLSTMLCEARLGFAVHHPLGIVSGLLNGA